MRLVAYIRVSKVGGREGDSFQSPEQQRAAIEHIVALTSGARVVEWIEELDESGGTMDRPGVRRAIELVDGGQADGIVTAYLDRWARTVQALELIERWTREGKTFLTAREKFDTSSAHGRFALGMMLLVAQLQREQAAERWEVSTSGAIARGVHTTVPYGYRRGDGNGREHKSGGTRGAALVPVEPAASVVRRIFAERLAGRGIAAIASGLNADEVPAPSARQWTRQTVRALARNRVYTGEARYGEHVHPGAHEALVSEQDWKAAQPSKREPRTRHGGGSLLAGLVRCGGCGYVMGASSSRSGRRYNCGRQHGTGTCPEPTTAQAEQLEQLAEAAFLERHGAARVQQENTDDPAVAETRAELERAAAEFIAWRDDTAMREVLGAANYRAGLIARKQAHDTAEEAHEAAVRESEAAGLVVDRADYASWPVEQRRTLLGAALERVTVSRAASTRTPLVERVEFSWRGELDAEPSLGLQLVPGCRTVITRANASATARRSCAGALTRPPPRRRATRGPWTGSAAQSQPGITSPCSSASGEQPSPWSTSSRSSSSGSTSAACRTAAA